MTDFLVSDATSSAPIGDKHSTKLVGRQKLVDDNNNEIGSLLTSSDAPFTVTPHATNALSPIPKALYIGTGGNVTLRGVGGSADVVFKNLPSGFILPVRAQYVRATGTTAADILGLA